VLLWKNLRFSQLGFVLIKLSAKLSQLSIAQPLGKIFEKENSMKNVKLLILLLLFFNLYSYSQINVIIKFKDNREITDLVKSKGKKLISLKNKNKYNYDDISEIKVINEKTITDHFYIVDTKLYSSSRKKQKGLAYKVYSKGEIELFHIRFSLELDKNYNFPKYYNPEFETFIKRKNGRYAYNIGCIDGVGCVKIKERLKDFFNDCPNLIQMINENKINEREIIKIIDYYNESCTK